MTDKYVAPRYNADAFNCPYCGVYAYQVRYNAFLGDEKLPHLLAVGIVNAIQQLQRDGVKDPIQIVNNIVFTQCARCLELCVWVAPKGHEVSLAYPAILTAPQALDDMPIDVKVDYEEARGIVNKSPRGAAALLRLALQKLMVHLGESGNNINMDIANLVIKGLPEGIQEALDVMRVIGNNAVHPGQMSLDDDIDTATALFSVLNFIVERMIKQPKVIGEIYKILPTSALDGIKKRDGKA